jgi:hypothetical protein
MIPKQKQDFNRMLTALHLISRGYQTTSQIKRDSEKQYGLDYTEALEMAYENIQEEARAATLRIKLLK